MIREVERVYIRDNGKLAGGGAVLGAIGRRARQHHRQGRRPQGGYRGGAHGGFAGNAIERNNGDNGGRLAWQFGVRMPDDGRYTVTQWDNGDLRPATA